MDLRNNLTSRVEFERLQNKEVLSLNELYSLARYPYVSLSDYCGKIYGFDLEKVKKLEDLNVFYFLNTLKIIIGEGTPEESLAYRKALSVEPLRSAVIISQYETHPRERFISLCTNVIRILMSPKDGGTRFREPINIGIVGNMPRDFLKSRQPEANQWFNNFIELKLDLLAKACRKLDVEKVFPFMLMSIAYSLYKFTPYRYPVSQYKDENDNLHIVLNKFFDQIEIIRK